MRPVMVQNIVRVPRFSPPPISFKHTLDGKSGKRMGAFDFGAIPSSVAIAAVGGVAAYFADILPDTPKVVVRSLGFLAIGYAVFNLFAKEAAAQVEETGITPKPTATPSAFSRITGKFVRPLPNSEVDLGLFSRDYDVSVIWYNNSSEKVSFSWDILAEETPYGTHGGIGGETLSDVVYKSQTELPPGSNTGPLSVEVDTLYAKIGRTLSIRLTLRKYDHMGRAVPMSSVTFSTS